MGQEPNEFISKLKDCEFDLFPDLFMGADEFSGSVIVSKLEAKDMNTGLLAIVVNGEEDESGPSSRVLNRSRSIALEVAVGCGCGVSSRRDSILGSKLVSEVQSSRFVGLVAAREESGETIDDAVGDDVVYIDASGEKCRGAGGGSDCDFGGDIVNVKLDCLSITFSDCSLDSRSRRFSFSCWAASFFASSSATLSSS